MAEGLTNIASGVICRCRFLFEVRGEEIDLRQDVDVIRYLGL